MLTRDQLRQQTEGEALHADWLGYLIAEAWDEAADIAPDHLTAAVLEWFRRERPGRYETTMENFAEQHGVPVEVLKAWAA